MKIGTDFGLCVKDIVVGDIDIDDVLIIFSYQEQQFVDDSEIWERLWSYYSLYGMPWYGLDKDTTWSVIDSLEFYKRVHHFYPRMEPAWSYHWLELMITPKEILKNPQLKQMWEDIELMIKLTSTPEDK